MTIIVSPTSAPPWALTVRHTQRELLTTGHYTHKEPAFYLKALAGLSWRFYGCRKTRRQCWSRLYRKSVGPRAMSRSRRHSLGKENQMATLFFHLQRPVAHTPPVEPFKLEGWTRSSLSSTPSPKSTAPAHQRHSLSSLF